MENINDLQIGKAGEYLVCADLILKGFIAFPSEQGLPYDLVFERNNKLYKVQVKTTRKSKNIPQRKTPIPAYIFNIKRRGKHNKPRTSMNTCDIFALVALDSKVIGYLPNKKVKETMNFRCKEFFGKYKDENINTRPRGTYLHNLTLDKCLDQI
jgi:hypothetical protein